MTSNQKALPLSLLDLTLREFEELYYTNEMIFRSVNNWFYFANDNKVSKLSSKGYVCDGRNRNRTRSFGFPEDAHGGLVLLCRSEKIDIDTVRAKCAEEKNGMVHFKLNDGTEAHYCILKDTVGAIGTKDAEYPLLIVPNKPQTKIWPYSLKGNMTFTEASKEEGTLPYYVATGKIESLLPIWVKEDIGI